MRALTFNTWHGLSGGGLLRFGELEPTPRRKLRLQLQEREFLDFDADLLFLQELNPISARAQYLARILDCDEVHQGDQSGLKFAGLGFPSNLNVGLAILARKGLELKKLKSSRLSGPPGFIRGGASFQLAEFRYALFAEIQSVKWGRVILCAAHLHHGFELTMEFEKRLEKAVQEKVLSHYEFEMMIFALLACRTRRETEIAKLLEELKSLEKNCDGVLLAGDFNSTDEGIAYQRILQKGFVDVHAEMTRKPENTWDPVLNNSQSFQEEFVYPVPHFGRPEVQALLREHDLSPRRIDFLFAKGSVAENLKSATIWGAESRNGIFLSDHFGVCAEW